ncbi:hypothetical protein [Corynebacterium senegalense]|uniref:hypothetical protein n=1 Tax=Corynebacterium senegalense TaxID=2080750 RepID=UPI000E205DB3|nr:hypothetical protein [Corynebacterium senegalense]
MDAAEPDAPELEGAQDAPQPAEEKAGEGAPALEAPANTAADEVKALQSEIIKDAEKNSANTPEEQRNMPSLVAAGVAAGAPQPLAAAPLDYQGKSQEWYGMVTDADHKGQWEALKVYSPSMERDIPVAVRWAEDGQNNRIPGTPTVYLLNGAGGSEQNTDWVAKALGRVESTFRRQDINLVIPMEGAFSYYVDWLEVPTKNSYYHGKQVWGPLGSDYNRYNDALVTVENLAGTALSITNGSGLAGETDMIGYFLGKEANPQQTSANAQTLQIEGGVIEGMTNACTHDLRAKLNSKGIAATFKFRNTGTHSWPYWLDDLSESWVSVIGPALTGRTSEELGPKWKRN